MGITEQAGNVASNAINAMKGSPLAIALLLVNLVFMGFATYILGEVSANAKERNKGQMELIQGLVKDIRDCRAGPRTGMRSLLYRDSINPWEQNK